MQMTIKADEGDAIVVDSYQLSNEEFVVVLEVANASYLVGMELDRLTLSVEQARQLGLALLIAAEGRACSQSPYRISARIYREN
jgi:hypothetical protein